LEDWKCDLKAWPWHCSPKNYESHPGENRFECVDTSTVVQNPYSLMISEYYYLFLKKAHLVEDLIKKYESHQNMDAEV